MSPFNEINEITWGRKFYFQYTIKKEIGDVIRRCYYACHHSFIYYPWRFQDVCGHSTISILITENFLICLCVRYLSIKTIHQRIVLSYILEHIKNLKEKDICFIVSLIRENRKKWTFSWCIMRIINGMIPKTIMKHAICGKRMTINYYYAFRTLYFQMS